MLLQINKLSKTYPNGVKCLNEVDLSISKGMFGLLGPNGAGKSSLMRTIATLQLPDSGKVIFDGIDVHQNEMQLRMTLGYLPQQFGVYPKQSAVQLLDYFAILKGLSSKKQRAARIDELLHLTNLYGDRHRAVSSYSGGMKQRFGIAQMLLNKPRLIIVDEPTAGLDPAERRRFLNVLREIGQDNIVIFSTHLVDDVQELCSQLAIIQKGTILKVGSPTDCIDQLRNKVYQTTIKSDQLQELKDHLLVLSTSFDEESNLVARVFCEHKPDAAYKACDPTLEDAYFWNLNRA